VTWTGGASWPTHATKRAMRRLALALICIAACGDREPAMPADMATPAPTYAGAITLPTRADIDWTGVAGEGPITALRFTDSVGTIGFDGESLPAVIYQKIPFGPYTLAAIAATTDDGLLIAYAYCQNGGVTALYSETLTQSATPQDSVAMAGSCTFADATANGQIDFVHPSTLAYGPLEDLADVEGAKLAVHGGSGTLTIDGVGHALSVFTGVDCHGCGGAGWQELHVTLRHEQSLAFAILYLKADDLTHVQLAYGIRFDVPMLWPADAVYDASWTLK
jgi:hypothetical protein